MPHASGIRPAGEAPHGRPHSRPLLDRDRLSTGSRSRGHGGRAIDWNLHPCPERNRRAKRSPRGPCGGASGARFSNSAEPARGRRAEVELSFPLSNLGPSLPNLLATVAGNLFELKPFSGLRLIDIALPPAFLDRYQGPQFGVAGTRRFAQVYDRPLIGTIIKPSVGLSPDATAGTVESLA